MKKLKNKEVRFLLKQISAILKEGKLEIIDPKKEEKEENKTNNKEVCFDALDYFDNYIEKGKSLRNPRDYASIVAEFYIGRIGKGPFFSFRQGIKLCQIVLGKDIPEEDKKKFEKVLKKVPEKPTLDNEVVIHTFYNMMYECGQIFSEKFDEVK